MALQEDKTRPEATECMIDPNSAFISDSEKLRIIGAVIEDQSPFGTELANFRRRLQAVLRL